MRDKKAIKAVVIFLFVTFALTWSLDFLAILGYDCGFNTMLCPSIGAVVVKLLFYRNESVLGFRLCAPKYVLYAVLLPLFYIGVSYIAFLIFNRDAFSGGLYTNDPGALLFIFVSYLVSSAGEEIGWRGFLFPKLKELIGFNKAAITGGLIWSVWHYPVLIYYFSESSHMWYFLVMFTAEITLIGVMLAYLTLYSKSFIPAAILHACHNYFDQIIFGPMTNTYYASYFAGETGIITLILVAALTIMFVNRGKTASAVTF